MATRVQFRRGTTAEHSTFTGAEGEITVNTTKDTLVVHDGSTAGGFEIVSLAASQTLTNKTLTSPTFTAPVLGTPASGTLTNCTGLPVVSGISGLGTGVATALAVNTGTAGAFLVSGGALGTPSSLTLTNATGLPIATGVSGLGTGVATFLATPSSANLAAAVTGETGSGALVFGTSPSLTTPAITGATVGVSAAVTAGTNAQGQGALTSDYNVITTAASAPSGVTLPTATTGRRIVIVNKGANIINIYPATSGYIDALAINAAISLAPNGTMELMASSTTQWYSIDRLAIYDASGTLLN